MKHLTFNLMPVLSLSVHRELVEELHPLMKEALERRPEVGRSYLQCSGQHKQNDVMDYTITMTSAIKDLF